mgnify:CR=1 FL=1
MTILSKAGLVGGFRNGRSGFARLAGFGLSVAILGVAALLAIPAMVAASGPVAWGAIAVGQVIGLVASFIVTYGWKLSGPAKIARGDATERRREYGLSLRVRLTLIVPVGALATLFSCVVAHENPRFAAAGAVSAVTIGLSGDWYFAGAAMPFMMLLLETLPRAAGILVGVAMMRAGHSAVIGLAWTTLGMLSAFALVTVWVYMSTSHAGAATCPKTRLSAAFREQASSTVPGLVSAVYLAVPISIVSLVAPTALPTFALADKINRQFSQGLAPIITVLQGWVPKSEGAELAHRARYVFFMVCALGLALAGGLAFAGPVLFGWLGNGQIASPRSVQVITAILIGAYLVDQSLGRVVLVAFDRIGVIARASIVSAAVGLPLVLAGAFVFDAAGALLGVLAGLLVRIAIELAGTNSRGRQLLLSGAGASAAGAGR